MFRYQVVSETEKQLRLKLIFYFVGFIAIKNLK